MVAFPVSDDREREAALDPEVSCLVEAPAGSGKTGLLIQRYLTLLARVNDPREVLALTFTIKATAEMQERILSALREAEQDTPLSGPEFQRRTRRLALDVLVRDRDKDWRILHRPHLLNIRTIDSLCGQIARSVPLLSGEAGFAHPVPDASTLYHRAAHAVMRRFGGDDVGFNDAVHTVLLHRDGDLPFCERVLAEMLQSREQWGHLLPLGEELTEEYLDAEVLPRLNAALQRTVCGAMEELRNGFDDDVLSAIAGIAQRLASADGYKGALNPYTVCQDMTVPPGCSEDHLAYWRVIGDLLLTKDGWRKKLDAFSVKAHLSEADRQHLKDLISDSGSDELFELLDTVRKLEDVAYPKDQWRVSKALFRLLGPALVELKLLFAEEGVCDFSEISLAARAALRDGAGQVQEVLGTSIQHLLVDEMQDTSASQYDLLEQLTAGWDGRSQTVFLVGDPKQSIYLFRQARVDRFQRCMEDGRLGSVPLLIIRLRSNFRSGGHLVSESNGIFRQIFPSHQPPDGDVVFYDASAANPADESDTLAWRTEAIERNKDDLAANRRMRRASVRREARAITALIRHHRYTWQGKKPPRIAVLTRARAHVTEIAKQITDAGIPVRSIELLGLAEQQEVLDVLSITRALLHPADRVAWLAVLRAPWCGLTLRDLHLLAAGDQEAHRHEALRERFRARAGDLSPESQKRLLRTLDVFDAAIAASSAEPISSLAERTWRSLGGNLCVGPAAHANVEQFFRVLDTMAAEGEAVTQFALARRLEKLYAQPSHAADAVDILTVHRAKGLEWDVVILPGLHRQAGRSTYSALEWMELPEHHDDNVADVLLAPFPPKGGKPDFLLTFIRARRRRRIKLELKRLFYVGATRARTALYLFASPEITSKGIAHRDDTLLGAVWNAAKDQFSDPSRREESAVSLMSQLRDEAEPLALAAAADEAVTPERKLPKLLRLRSGMDPLARLHEGSLPLDLATPEASARPFTRPEGTFGARSVGKAIHGFVERLSREYGTALQLGEAPLAASARLLAEIGQWTAAIRATLRSGGLPPSVVERASQTVLRALANTLRSEDGRWILMPHTSAEDEAAWHTFRGDDDLRIRLDRSFYAGAHPGESGSGVFWIVDFKTGNHTGTGVDEFFTAERAKYEGQLRTYAAARRGTLPPGTPVMLALFYPLMGRMIYWPAPSQGRAEERIEPVRAEASANAHVPVVEAKAQLSLF